MPKIMADHDVEGHLRVLQSVWQTPDWYELWKDLGCEIESFDRLGLDSDASDAEIWRLCQQLEIVLVTGNRNAEGDDSLERVIRREGTEDSLPVFTIADPDRLMRNRDYAELVAERVIDYLIVFESLRGAGRLYLP